MGKEATIMPPSPPLRAGTAGVTVTPEWPVHMECHPHHGVVTQTLDPLTARAIVFDDGACRVALVSVDLTGIEAECAERVQQAAAAAAGIPAGQILIMCSHTHSAPATTRFKAVPIDAAYQRWLEARLAQVVVAASQNLVPVTLGAGQGQLDFNVNRRQRTPAGMVLGPSPAGLVDRRVRVLRVDPADAPAPRGPLAGRVLPQCEPLAVLFAYPCHPTVMGDETHQFNGDYPGAARRRIEQAYVRAAHASATPEEPRNTHAFFLPAYFGNLRPYLLGTNGQWRQGTPHELEVIGRLLASEVVQVAERIVGESMSSIAFARRRVTLPYAHVASVEELREALSGRRGWWARSMLDTLARDGRLPDGETVEVQVVRLGRHWLIATPGETMLEIGLAIERSLAEYGLAHPEQGDLTLALGYTNNYAGYLCTASAMQEGGYEPGAWWEYQRPGPFAPQLESILVTTALELAQELGPARSQSPTS
jgi:hypothetical protein